MGSLQCTVPISFSLIDHPLTGMTPGLLEHWKCCGF
jgi:hypothetical protein